MDASQHEFPSDMFLPGSELREIEENIDKIVYGLTQWQPRMKKKAVKPQKKLVIEAGDYSNALHKMNAVFIKNRWGDGLPLLPATEDRVDWLLTGTDLSRNQVIGDILPSGNTATVESLAINLALTGGRPEYMPVLIAAVKALIDPRFRHQMMQTTTCSVNIAAVVNGNIGKQIRLNAGYGCLGPDAGHPAGACIGRALRLCQQNIGQTIPGKSTMALFGGPLKFANCVFAEDEEGLPGGWDPLNVDRGFKQGSNVITIHAVATSTNISCIHASNQETVMETMNYFARIMGSDYGNIFLNYFENNAPGILIMPRGIAKGISDAGWSKQKVKAFLWENSKFSWSVMSSDSDVFYRSKDMMEQYVPPGDPWPIAVKPENLMIVVAGGKQSGHGYWMRMGCCPTEPISMEIELPKNWEALLENAEADLGPISEM